MMKNDLERMLRLDHRSKIGFSLCKAWPVIILSLFMSMNLYPQLALSIYV